MAKTGVQYGWVVLFLLSPQSTNTLIRFPTLPRCVTAMFKYFRLSWATVNNIVDCRDDHTELSSCERYDPKTGTWDPIVAMTCRRSGVGLAIVNGLMFAVGGFDGNYYLRSAEVYDPETNAWRPCATMNYRRLGGGVAVLTSLGGSGGRSAQHEQPGFIKTE